MLADSTGGGRAEVVLSCRGWVPSSRLTYTALDRGPRQRAEGVELYAELVHLCNTASLSAGAPPAGKRFISWALHAACFWSSISQWTWRTREARAAQACAEEHTANWRMQLACLQGASSCVRVCASPSGEWGPTSRSQRRCADETPHSSISICDRATRCKDSTASHGQLPRAAKSPRVGTPQPGTFPGRA